MALTTARHSPRRVLLVLSPVHWIFLHWVGARCPPLAAGRANTRKASCHALLQPTSLEIFATTFEELTPEILIDKACAAAAPQHICHSTSRHKAQHASAHDPSRGNHVKRDGDAFTKYMSRVGMLQVRRYAVVDSLGGASPVRGSSARRSAAAQPPEAQSTFSLSSYQEAVEEDQAALAREFGIELADGGSGCTEAEQGDENGTTLAEAVSSVRDHASPLNWLLIAT